MCSLRMIKSNVVVGLGVLLASPRAQGRGNREADKRPGYPSIRIAAERETRSKRLTEDEGR